MAATQLKTFDDLLDACMEELRLQSSDTTNRTRLKRIMNEVYLDHVCADGQFTWLRGNVTLQLPEAITGSGTVSVTEGSVSATLSAAPALSRAGYYFNVPGDAEIYRIAEHTAASTTIKLDTPYLGETSTAASYSIWTDALALPAEARDVFLVETDHQTTPLDGLSYAEFRRHAVVDPACQGRPEMFTTSDFKEPSPYSAIGSLPLLSTRASAGYLKTLVFATTVASLLEVGDRIQVTAAGSYAYAGEHVVASVSTTTITFNTSVALQESATADATLTVKLLNGETTEDRYRELLVYPALNTDPTNLHVDYIREVRPLEDDADEPLMPISDRSVLKYGTLMFAWGSIMKDERQQDKNEARFYAKMAKMKGRLGSATSQARLVPSKSYLARKRTRQTARWDE